MNILGDAFDKKTRKRAHPAAVATSIELDYPQEGESITSGDYTIRISAGPSLKNPEVSLNNGDSWQLCRPDSGYWWYDWQGYTAGPKLILARGETETGKKIVSRRQFTVEFK